MNRKFRCNTPPYPEHGKWKLVKGKAKPGDRILEGSVIIFECDPGYKLSTKIKYLFCDEDWEYMDIPECEGKNKTFLTIIQDLSNEIDRFVSSCSGVSSAIRFNHIHAEMHRQKGKTGQMQRGPERDVSGIQLRPFLRDPLRI